MAKTKQKPRLYTLLSAAPAGPARCGPKWGRLGVALMAQSSLRKGLTITHRDFFAVILVDQVLSVSRDIFANAPS